MRSEELNARDFWSLLQLSAILVMSKPPEEKLADILRHGQALVQLRGEAIDGHPTLAAMVVEIIKEPGFTPEETLSELASLALETEECLS